MSTVETKPSTDQVKSPAAKPSVAGARKMDNTEGIARKGEADVRHQPHQSSQGKLTIPSVDLPASVPTTTTRVRPPKENVPQTKLQRDHILRQIQTFVARENPTPPLPLADLQNLTDQFLEEHGTDPKYRDYCGILINNELWRETLAAIPYERRLLLMPKCLRVEDKCPAPFDEFGLLCKQCGLCTIEDFQNEAERLGYAVLVAEGSAVVMSLIQTGKIEAIVGISCLPVLERTFPYVEAAAIPSCAVPLLQDDCINTTVDNDWVWDLIHLTSEDTTRRLDISALHEEVQTWFKEDVLADTLGISSDSTDPTEKLALQWLGGSGIEKGKRWRPYLAVATHLALQDQPAQNLENLPDSLRKLAVAIECFHKASLLHDDIADEDHERYGAPTLHTSESVGISLNLGDYLIGLGYQLLTQLGSNVSAHHALHMTRIAAEGHLELSRGQGLELHWAKHPQVLSSKQTLEIFRQKTSPAFEVALQLGALHANAWEEHHKALSAYSSNLGIAYQIKDDLEDLAEDSGENEHTQIRPSLLLALCHERAKGEDKALLAQAWSGEMLDQKTRQDIRLIAAKTGALDKAKLLLETYKESAIRSLQDLDNANLKGLLRRTLGKIFGLEIKGWCSEVQDGE